MRSGVEGAVLALGLLFLGCDDGGSGGGAADAASPGGGGGDAPRALYDGAESAALGAALNQATCATCHSVDGTPRSGATLQDIAYRTGFKGGAAPTLLAATNACITGWIGGPALSADDPKWTRLEAFLRSISDRAVTAPHPSAPEVLEDEAAYARRYAGGDAAAGEAAYTRACAVCHDSGLVVGQQAAYPRATLSAYSEGRIAQKVRTSGPPPSGLNDLRDSTHGPMPYFEPSDLPEEDLRDIVAFLKSQQG